ncbi:MAG TPA: hypothetical protein VIS06_16255, partial [Mycobacteriales bacterium]
MEHAHDNPDTHDDPGPQTEGRPLAEWWLAVDLGNPGTLPNTVPSWARPTTAGYRSAVALIGMAINATGGDYALRGEYNKIASAKTANYGNHVYNPTSGAAAVKVGMMLFAGRLAARTVSEAVKADDETCEDVELQHAVGRVIGGLWPEWMPAPPNPKAFQAGMALRRCLSARGYQREPHPGLVDLARAGTVQAGQYPAALHHL